MDQNDDRKNGFATRNQGGKDMSVVDSGFREYIARSWRASFFVLCLW